MKATFAGAADETLTRFNTGGRGSMDLMTLNKDFQRSVIESDIELFQPLDLARIPNARRPVPRPSRMRLGGSATARPTACR